ncbi:MAG: 16S rRNA (adenine(1518)-N(6)/adenine(1519)-N(6)) -dimethyltransferase RsmA [Candidatus Improbicoccus devescovinae]|nr:MAG: 16S rRNA (adenine(1518)-N(6)/adenine(1519)-N(6)) -dimethyltransferase RsmA [Candidatus Improbicoccus devescovinae]
MNKYNIYSASGIKSICEFYNIRASKKLGQNFLIDFNISKKIIKTIKSNIQTSDTVIIEIGPGLGALTYILADEFNQIFAVEYDKKLVQILQENIIINKKNVNIINYDALKFDYKQLINIYNLHNKNIIICANLPYYITTPLISRFLEESISDDGKLNWTSLTVMVQKETSDRLISAPGTKNCGAISVLVRFFSEPEKIFNISKNCFFPIPKVDSSLISFKINNNNIKKVKNKKNLFKITKILFSERRKMILKNLIKNFDLKPQEIINILDKLNLSSNLRPENLSLENLINLSNNF